MDRGGNERGASSKTRALLARDNVTIFEAAVAANNLFARIDILRKSGRRLELYEVKAKSYENSDGNFLTSKGKIASEFLPYLRDVAFQRLILDKAYPDFELSCHLVLVDKSCQATVDGLNQRFKVRRSGNVLKTIVADGTNATTIGAPLLATINVDERVSEILASPIELGDTEMAFDEAVERLAEAYRTDTPINRVSPDIVQSANSGLTSFRQPTTSAAAFMSAGAPHSIGRPKTSRTARCSISMTFAVPRKPS